MKSLKETNQQITHTINHMTDGRLTYAVFSYILENGYNNVQNITDEEISTIKGSGIFTSDRLLQSIVEAAREICEQFTVKDILSYIISELFIFGVSGKELYLYRDDFQDENRFNEIYEEIYGYDDEVENVYELRLKAMQNEF